MQKQVYTESVTMSCPCQSEMYSVILFCVFVFLSWSMMSTFNSIKTGYKVYKVQKVDEIS